jgi:molybdate/tungstate transport system substrate-binding protein
MRLIFLSFVTAIFLLTSCLNSQSGETREIIVFHAGSLSVPFKQLKNGYEKKNPGVSVLLEAAGSLVCARKITELKKPCDIIASADYIVIKELLIPEYTKWNISFATNEMVIAYHNKSRYFSDINSDNWIDILLKNDVIYGRSDPDSDPGGYRTVLLLMLAEKYYGKEGLTRQIVTKNADYVRPKEVDLIALIESSTIDYMFQYKSVAIQHGLSYVELPDEINLSDLSKAEIYRSVSTYVTGSKPGTRIKISGDYINYGMTVLTNAPHRIEAINFMCYMLSEEGQNILRMNGQDPIIPITTEPYEDIPAELLQYMPDNKVKL